MAASESSFGTRRRISYCVNEFSIRYLQGESNFSLSLFSNFDLRKEDPDC